MSIPYRARKLFYQNGHLSVELGGATIGSIFRNNGVPLAQRLRDEGSDKMTPMPGDQKNSVLGLLGSSRTDVAYTPYGYAPFTKEECLLLGFNGQHRSFGPDLYFLGNGYRIYSSILNRFYSSDTWSPFGDGGLNAYAYCAGDPVNWADPSGHMRRSPVARTPVLHRGRLNSTGSSIHSSVESLSSDAASPSRSSSPVSVNRHHDTVGAPGNGRAADDFSALFTIEGSSNQSPTSNTATRTLINRVGVPLDFTIPENDTVGQAALREMAAHALRANLSRRNEIRLRTTLPSTPYGIAADHLALGDRHFRFRPAFLNRARVNQLRQTS